MSAVEEIQAAIVKLTEMHNFSNEGSTPRTWKSTPLSPFIQADVIDSEGDVIAERCYAPDAELIVTLHRTIDAQLHILAAGLHGLILFSGEMAHDPGAVALARAINGTA